MLNIEKVITNLNLSSEIREGLLRSIENIKLNQHHISSSDTFITDIAKSFASQNSALVESSSVIPEILMQKNFKIIDFLINTKVIGVYFVLGFILLFGWFFPVYTIKDVILYGDQIHWKDYYFFGVILAQLAYYRFLWKKLMP